MQLFNNKNGLTDKQMYGEYTRPEVITILKSLDCALKEMEIDKDEYVSSLKELFWTNFISESVYIKLMQIIQAPYEESLNKYKLL